MLYQPSRMIALLLPIILGGCAMFGNPANAPLPGGLAKGELFYANPFASADQLKNWKMEGPGRMQFDDGWMTMDSPGGAGHIVNWCPVVFPDSFVAEWDVQHLEKGLGLCIVFIAAEGLNGEDIFAPSLPKRTGVFEQYVNGAIRNYHVSYYANPDDAPDRQSANVRKNPGSHLVLEGDEGIPTASMAIHHMRLVKDHGHIMMFDDGRKFVDWTDDGQALGPIYGEGKIGLRQMKWTGFRYRDFKVWTLKR